MVEIKALRNSIVKGIEEHLDIGMIPIETTQKKRVYPFVTYSFVSPYTQFNGMGNYSEDFVPSTDERFEYDVEESLELQPQSTISINCYSDDKMEATEQAHNLMAWFKHGGYQFLSENNIVVVGIEAFGERPVLIVDHYEARIGFDVIVRFTDVLKRRYETIEDFNIDTKDIY